MIITIIVDEVRTGRDFGTCESRIRFQIRQNLESRVVFDRCLARKCGLEEQGYFPGWESDLTL